MWWCFYRKTFHKALGGNDVIKHRDLINVNPKEKINLHSTLTNYSRYYDNISDFYIFSFVRNPWRRMVSHWEYLVEQMYNKRVAKKDILNFSSFVQLFPSKFLGYNMLGYDEFLADKKNTKLNFVGKLENIDVDLKQIGLEIKIEIKEILHVNKTNPSLKVHNDWKQYYNPKTKDIVYNIFKDDINKYEYDF